MGYFEFLVHFYIINAAWLVKLSDINFDPLIYHPSSVQVLPVAPSTPGYYTLESENPAVSSLRGRFTLVQDLQGSSSPVYRQQQGRQLLLFQVRRPVPCSLLPAPCFPLAARCSLLAAPCSLLPAPCSLLPAPCSLLSGFLPGSVLPSHPWLSAIGEDGVMLVYQF